MDIYLVINNDYDGDLTVCVITKEVFDWINQPYNGDKSTHSYKEVVPDYVTTWEDADADHADAEEERFIYITIGSWQNDRALYVNSNVDGFKPYYNDIVEFFKDLKGKNAEVIDVFEGMIY